MRFDHAKTHDVPTVSEKRCHDCDLVKPAEEFHRNRQGSDGLQARCKLCQKVRIKIWREQQGGREKHAAGQRRYLARKRGDLIGNEKRSLNPERSAAVAKNWRRNNKDKTSAAFVRWRNRYPNIWRAHRAVLGAIRAGKLSPQPCEVCRTNQDVHAHHDDYLKRLDVRWLCRDHHQAWHVQHGRGKNFT